MPLQATSGAASYDAFGGGAAAVPQYIEDVFSTWLYTGNGSTQTITNGIDLAGKGGLVWTKSRSVSGSTHALQDTVRGANNYLQSQTTSANINLPDINFAFNSNGFSQNNTFQGFNNTGDTYASWTFRKQPKFFDVVTWTATSTTNTNLRVSHNLGSVPGCIFIKATSTTDSWYVYHRELGINQYVRLNATSAAVTNTPSWGTSNPTSTDFGFNENLFVASAPTTFVAYIFAHNAGGFGLTGTDNVISCGSYTGTGATGNAITLGYEPQYLLTKATSTTGNWTIVDTMRGFSMDTDNTLQANTSNAEAATTVGFPTATGFTLDTTGNPNASGVTYIYIAIRRGPMRVPTTGTSVFSPNQTSGTTGTPITTGFPVDWQVLGINAGNVNNQRASTRLTGVNTDGTSNSQLLITSLTNAESATASATRNWGNTGFQVPSLNSGNPIITWNFRRAPGFFDVVCYTGTGVARTVAHNLAAVPELIITKTRALTGGGSGANWAVYHSAIGNTKVLFLNSTNAASAASANWWNNTTPTTSVFTVGIADAVNASATALVAYLFASAPGVSKVFNFTGNGSSQTINCGFTGGARFVMIKRTDSTGDWYVWDSARGIVSGNDPRLSLNTTAAEVTTDDSVDTDSTGFIVNQLAATNINVSSATYIGIAIA